MSPIQTAFSSQPLTRCSTTLSSSSPLQSPTTWQPLYDAARNHPSVNFQAIINPNSGPGASACPNGNDTNYINAIATINSLPNIPTLGYVHTATSSTCGDNGQAMCVCTQPQAALQANISTYQNWPTAGCSNGENKDIHVDGIFFDESPINSTCLSYIRSITPLRQTYPHPRQHRPLQRRRSDSGTRLLGYRGLFQHL